MLFRSHIIVPQPFLYQVAGVETEFFSVIICRLIHVRQYTNTARTYTLRTVELLTLRDCFFLYLGMRHSPAEHCGRDAPLPSRTATSASYASCKVDTFTTFKPSGI